MGERNAPALAVALHQRFARQLNAHAPFGTGIQYNALKPFKRFNRVQLTVALASDIELHDVAPRTGSGVAHGDAGGPAFSGGLHHEVAVIKRRVAQPEPKRVGGCVRLVNVVRPKHLGLGAGAAGRVAVVAQRNLALAAWKGHGQTAVGLAAAREHVVEGASAHRSGLPGPENGGGSVLNPRLEHQRTTRVHHQHHRLAGCVGLANQVLLYGTYPQRSAAAALARFVSVLADGQHQHVVLAQGFNRRVVGPGIGLIQREFRVKRFLTHRVRRRSHVRPLTRHGLRQLLRRLVFGRNTPVAQHAVFLCSQRSCEPDAQARG